MKIEIYTDGSCRGNPGPGGWGTVILCEEKEIQGAGQITYTTNQQMELLAAIRGLERMKKELEWENSNIIVYTDSAYLYNCWKDGWWRKWVFNGWKNSKNESVANQELWEQLLPWFKMSNFSIVKVKGHETNKYNNIADLLATGAVRPESNV